MLRVGQNLPQLYKNVQLNQSNLNSSLQQKPAISTILNNIYKCNTLAKALHTKYLHVCCKDITIILLTSDI